MKLLRTEAEILDAYRNRITELGLTFETVDAISGMASGYTAKLMCGMKGVGPLAREGLNGALGIAFVAVEDPQQIEKVRGRWVKRKRAIDRKKRGALASRFSIDCEVPVEISITPELKAQLKRREYMKMIGKRGGEKGGKRRLKTMGKRARQAAASHAARKRWAKAAHAARLPPN